MNVCLISEEYPPETLWGGIGTYSFNLATGLRGHGHRVHVISRTWERQGVEESDGILVHRVAIPEPSWRWGTWYWNLQFPESRAVWLWNVAVKRTLDAIFADDRIDVIESPEFHAQGLLSAAVHRNVPWVIKLHTPAYLCRRLNGATPAASSFDRLITEQAERWLTYAAQAITSPSRCLAEDVSREWNLRHVQVIPNPIDEMMFRPAASGAADSMQVLFVGRLERRKGVEVLVQAFAEIHHSIPQARLCLIGNDHPSGADGQSMKTHLLHMLSDAGVAGESFEFAGNVPRERLPALYRGASVCVIPSLYENFPYTCLEAMACGCAVIASRTGGLPEIITNTVDGILVPPGDSRSLGQAIAKLLGDPERRRQLGRRARQTICSRFSRAAISRQTAESYQSVLSSG